MGLSNHRIADLRGCPENITQAKVLFEQIAGLEVDLAVEEARTEKRIAVLKKNHEAKVAGRKAVRDRLAEKLAAFIRGNTDLFRKPKKVKTPFGSFGLQKVSEVRLLVDDVVVVNNLKILQFESAVQTLEKLDKPELKRILQNGFDIPGTRLLTGETAVYKVDKALVDEATKGVGE